MFVIFSCTALECLFMLERFRLLSYNILADYLAIQHSMLYSHLPFDMLSWHWRMNNLLFEFQLWSPDVLCLQVLLSFSFVFFFYFWRSFGFFLYSVNQGIQFHCSFCLLFSKFIFNWDCLKAFLCLRIKNCSNKPLTDISKTGKMLYQGDNFWSLARKVKISRFKLKPSIMEEGYVFR